MQRWWRVFYGVIIVGLVGCGAATPTATPVAKSRVQAVLAASNLVVGPNRLPIGLIVDGSPINDPNVQVKLRLYYLDGTDAEKTQVAGEGSADYFGQGLPAGIYVTYPDFKKAGDWGVEVEATLPGKEPTVSTLRLSVLAQDPTPAIGSKAIAVDTPTVKTAPDLSQISSDPNPNPALYQLSIADAIKSGKPTAILFGTPGFCKTATCGPSVTVLGNLQKTYGEKMNFIHVEVYKFPFSESVQANPPLLVPAMAEWRLQSEPWLFLLGKDGTIVNKYEGGITTEELGPMIDTILAQGI